MSNNITNTVIFLKQSTSDLTRKKEFPPCATNFIQSELTPLSSQPEPHKEHIALPIQATTIQWLA
ncbi:hypothetical protein SAMN05216563_106288 [Phytobacter palmae]|nr:hypothetical protein SAMN05216563_106288 [Phytobacter palmae]